MSQIYLVGTHHLDLKGPERLEKFLNFVRPRFIAIECDEEIAQRKVEEHDLLVRELNQNRAMFRLIQGEEAADKMQNEYSSAVGRFNTSTQGFYNKQNAMERYQANRQTQQGLFNIPQSNPYFYLG